MAQDRSEASAHMAQDRSEEDEEQVELNTANARGSHTQALTTLRI